MEIRKFLRDSKAVSPVIGVMLMLVVTVILAAAVSAYSSGMMDTSSKAPTAVFDTEIIKDADAGDMGTVSEFVMKEVTGDPIQTDDLKLVTINPNADGVQIMEVLPNSDNTHYWNLDYLYWTNGTSPFWNNAANGYFGSTPEDNFGNFTLKPGITMTSQEYSNYQQATWNATTGTYDGASITGMQAIIADWGNVSEGDFITVKLVHMPSGKVIYNADVEVQ